MYILYIYICVCTHMYIYRCICKQTPIYIYIYISVVLTDVVKYIVVMFLKFTDEKMTINI